MMRRFFLFFLFFAFFSAAAFAIDSQEICRVRVENRTDGEIAVSFNRGLSWEAIGKVLRPAEKVNKDGFAAARWVEEGVVAGTAVNAIHVKTGARDKERSVFSLLPLELGKIARSYRSFYSASSSIYTNVTVGEGIFGGPYTPFVGNRVKRVAPSGELVSLRSNYVPKAGDVLYILVERPVDYPKEIVFENSFGGKILQTGVDGETKVIGTVLRPVLGIGRFDGSFLAGPGRIRANHPGVIDVAVAPLGSLGGFQIVPAAHGDDLAYVREKTQWMVVGPANVEDNMLEGMPPLFRYFIRPSYNANDIYRQDWHDRFLRRFLVEVKYEGKGNWQAMPIFALQRDVALPGWANTALKNVTHFRILFPAVN